MPDKMIRFEDWREGFVSAYKEDLTADLIIELKKLQYLEEISDTLTSIDETLEVKYFGRSR